MIGYYELVFEDDEWIFKNGNVICASIEICVSSNITDDIPEVWELYSFKQNGEYIICGWIFLAMKEWVLENQLFLDDKFYIEYIKEDKLADY